MLTRRDLLRASASVPAAALPLSLLISGDARDYKAFLETETARIKSILKELGLA